MIGNILQHDIFHDLLLQLLIDHGIAAVLDDKDLAVIFADIGQRLYQNFRSLMIGHQHRNVSFTRHCETSAHTGCGNP